MNKGALLAVAVVLAYLGLEVYAVNRLGYRMEAPYILDQLVAAGRAIELCAEPEVEQREKFLRNLEIVRKRALRELAEARPEASAEEIEGSTAARLTAREQDVDVLVGAKGCDDMGVWKHLRRFEIYARLNLG